MELTDLFDLSVKVLPLTTIIDQFREDGEDTEDSDNIYNFFSNRFTWGDNSFSLVQVVDVIERIGEEEGARFALRNLLIDLEQRHPGAYINLEG
jgi:hypothetical protein